MLIIKLFAKNANFNTKYIIIFLNTGTFENHNNKEKTIKTNRTQLLYMCLL